MASLLKLYQQDAEAADPNLTRPVTSVGTWVEATKDYLDRLHTRYDRADDVPVKRKKLAASCLNLAAQAGQIAASIQDDLQLPPPRKEPRSDIPALRRFAVITIIILILLTLNVWAMSGLGIFSVAALLATSVLLHWDEIGVITQRLRSPRVSKQEPKTGLVSARKARIVTCRPYIESVVRRIDDIISLDELPAEALPSLSLKVETLQFFQDILEAQITDDQNYAFKKISRTLIDVLLTEGIEVVIDSQDHMTMFSIDTVPDDSRAGEVEVIRPALVKDANCIMTGYAHKFIRAAGDQGRA